MVKDYAGQTLKGYEVAERIGKGGFGAVYRAYQPLIKRDVAVKVILTEHANTPQFVRRFEAEAQLVANLEHPHIVPLYDYWRDADGAFLVMRWLRGGSMKDVLAQGTWPPTDVPRVVDQIAGALTVAHRNGVIHRDIKPENILLDDEKNAYLADFGIAFDTQRITDSASIIQDAESGQLVGSPDFMAPEQIQMDAITQQTDVYALGILLYMMLTGRKPYEADNLAAVIMKHLHEPVPHIREFRPDLPEDLSDVIARATEKSADDRYESVAMFAVDVRRALVPDSPTTADGLGGATLIGLDTGQLAPTEPFVNVGSADHLPTQMLHVDPVNPYKGLRAFQEADAANFFGRAAQVSMLLDRMTSGGRQGRFVVLVGASGSGKSSLVRAGLIPRLREDDKWFVSDMSPGSHPIEELEAALLRVAVNPPSSLIEQLTADERGLCRATKRILPGGDDSSTEVVLFIDQFEELFTQVEAEADRAAFLDLLIAAADDDNCRLRIILTIRADLYDRPLLYPEFGALVRECSEVILPLTQQEMTEAIVQPAQGARLQLEEGLVEEIIADVRQQPGILPMMQYALTELFERREGNRLTKAAYNDIGGVSGALAGRATDLYNALDEADQAVARQVFLRLVALGEGADDTRRRAKLEELLSLGDSDQVRAVVDQFGKYRLLTFDHDPATRAPTVEVAHEALIRQWEQLRLWLDESRDDLRTQRRLSVAANDWQQSGKDVSFLLSGARLAQFEDWRAHTTLRLTETETAFVDASISRRAELAEIEAERAARETALEKRSRRVLRALAGVMSVAAVIAVGLSLLAFNQRNTAINNANAAATARAEAQTSEQRARTLAFTSGAQAELTQGDTDLALLLGLEAADLSPTSVQVAQTLAQVAYTPATRRVYTGHTDRIQAVAYRADGQRAASVGDRGEVFVWDVATGEALPPFEGHPELYTEGELEEAKVNIVYDVAFSADGSQLLTGAEDGTAILWDAETGDMIHRLEGHTDVVKAVAFAPDGATALTASHDQTMLHWDLATGEVLAEFAGHSDWVNDVTFSQSGITALSASANGEVILWVLASGQPALQLQVDDIEIYTIQYTPDDLGFMTGATDGTLRLWTFEAQAPIRRYEGHADRVTDVSFSSDGSQVVTSSQDDSIIRWDFRTGEPLQRYLGHTNRVYGVAFDPTSDARFLSASWDQTLRLWDTQNGALLREITVHNNETRAMAVSVDGAYGASGDEDGLIQLWQLDAPQADPVTLTLNPNDCRAASTAEEELVVLAVRSLVFSPDSATLYSGSRDGDIREWDVATGELVRCMGGEAGGHSDIVYAVDIDPTGTQLLSGARDNSVIFWDVETGEALARQFEHTFHVLDVEYSPDGAQAVSAGRDANVIVWDTTSFEVERTFTGHNDWVFTATYSPDGSNVLSGGAENNLIRWDVASGQPLNVLEGHDSFIQTATFSPNGDYVVTGSADGQFILWNVAESVELQRVQAHTDDIRRIVFLDETTVVTASDDAQVWMWGLRFDTPALLEWVAENRYVGEPTCQARDVYNLEPLCPPPAPIFDDGTA